LLTTLGTWGCEEKIDLELRSGETFLVIDAYLDNQTGCRVELGLTTEFFQSGKGPHPEGAMVWLTGPSGKPDTLTPNVSRPWVFTNRRVRAQEGETWQLNVAYQGRLYTAVGTANRVFPIDSLRTFYLEQGPAFLHGWYAYLFGQEPLGQGDYYLVNRYKIKDGTRHYPVGDRFVWRDRLRDGNYMQIQLYGRKEEEKQDTFLIELASIDQTGFEFFRAIGTLENTTGTDPFDPPPWNPTSNVLGGALGYFRVSMVSQDTLQPQQLP
jgi:hypothetical protein